MSRRMIVFVSPPCHVPPRDRVHLSIVSCPAARSCPPLHRFMAHRMIVLVSPSLHVPPHDRARLSIVSCPTALPSLPLRSNSVSPASSLLSCWLAHRVVLYLAASSLAYSMPLHSGVCVHVPSTLRRCDPSGPVALRGGACPLLPPLCVVVSSDRA